MFATGQQQTTCTAADTIGDWRFPCWGLSPRQQSQPMLGELAGLQATQMRQAQLPKGKYH